MKLSVLITVLNEQIYDVVERLVPQIKSSQVVISHQITKSGVRPLESVPKGVKYCYMFERGLSRNRNNAIKFATGDVCLICDADVNFVDGFEQRILQVYRENPLVDVAIFKSLNLQGEQRKSYPKVSVKLNFKSILSVNSIEISFRRKAVLDKGIVFNESFGLGAKFCSGEENIFLADCLRRDLSLCFFPQFINVHPQESSGVVYSKNRIITNMKVFRYIYGFGAGFLALFFFAFYHYRLYSKVKISVFEYFKIGFCSFFMKRFK